MNILSLNKSASLMQPRKPWVRPLAAFIAAWFVGCAMLAAANHPLKIAGADRTKVGIYIEDLRTGKVLEEVNSAVPMVPASVNKSLTTATAYCTFSPRGTFSTPVMINGKVKKGVLDGDVIIATIGDPTIESQHFPDNLGFADSIVAAVQALGITEIKGTVVIDEGNFTDGTIPAGWLKEDLTHPYGAGLYATNFRDNRVSLSLPARTTSPLTPAIKFNMLGGKGAPSLSMVRDTSTFNVSGSLGKRGLHATVANPAPWSTMQTEVKRKLRAAGVEVQDAPRHPDKLTGSTLYVHTSPAVEEILRSLMFRSDNMMAEGMLRSLAQGETRREAVAAERRFWLEKGFDVSGMEIEDGSGLSRNDRITPRFLADVLKWMARTDMAGGFTSLFPKAGRDGTMRNFLKGTALEGRLATKTGSMRGVLCYGGYMLDDEGQPTHVVVVFVNNYTCGAPALKAEIGRLLLKHLTPKDLPSL